MFTSVPILALVLFEDMTVTFMDITNCSKCISSFSNEKVSNVRKDKMTVTFSSLTIPVDAFYFVPNSYYDKGDRLLHFFHFLRKIRLSLSHTIIPDTFSIVSIIPYKLCSNGEVTDFLSFCTFVIIDKYICTLY